jgi:hypothetical protein
VTKRGEAPLPDALAQRLSEALGFSVADVVEAHRTVSTRPPGTPAQLRPVIHSEENILKF